MSTRGGLKNVITDFFIPTRFLILIIKQIAYKNISKTLLLFQSSQPADDRNLKAKIEILNRGLNYVIEA